MKNQIRFIPANSIIVKSKLPDTDYVVNPYLGCAFGCLYCYASFMGRQVGETIDNWGNYVFVKQNCIEIFSKELLSFIKIKKSKSILFSSVTDPYQPIEAQLFLMKKMLEIIVSYQYEGKISILTKSPLVTRDIQIIKFLKKKEVGLTISCSTIGLANEMESKAPGFRARLNALKKLNVQGISTYAFVGPLMPHIFENSDQIEEIFKQISQVGTQEVFVEHLNITNYIKERIRTKVTRKCNLFNFYNNFDTKNFPVKSLNELINYYLKKYNLRLKLNQIITHH